jgi:hypothetical protein
MPDLCHIYCEVPNYRRATNGKSNRASFQPRQRHACAGLRITIERAVTAHWNQSEVSGILAAGDGEWYGSRGRRPE